MSRLCGGGQAPASSHKSWQAGARSLFSISGSSGCLGRPRESPAYQADTGAWLLAFPGSSSACRVREPTVGARGSRGGLSSPFRKPPNCASQSFLGSSGAKKNGQSVQNTSMTTINPWKSKQHKASELIVGGPAQSKDLAVHPPTRNPFLAPAPGWRCFS